MLDYKRLDNVFVTLILENIQKKIQLIAILNAPQIHFKHVEEYGTILYLICNLNNDIYNFILIKLNLIYVT